jgi:hypothetical protein
MYLNHCYFNASILRLVHSRPVKPFFLILFIFTLTLTTPGQNRTKPLGLAVVIDERLSALREEPKLTAPLVRRLGRGRKVSIVGTQRTLDGVVFYRVAVTRRTRGWIQSESLAIPSRKGEDQRLFSLIKASEDFDLIDRAQLFLDIFPRSTFRPAVLLLYGDTAEKAAERLSLDANRRLEKDEMEASGAPSFTYYMNYSGLDRYNRKGISFIYDESTKQFHYDGASWRELTRRYPHSPEAIEANKRLEKLKTIGSKNIK